MSKRKPTLHAPTRAFAPFFNGKPWLHYMAYDLEHVRKLWWADTPHADPPDVREVFITHSKDTVSDVEPM
jgi:hypothetical protein